MVRQFSIFIIILGSAWIMHAQVVRGYVFELHPDGSTAPLQGVNVYTADQKKGTLTDARGYFELEWHEHLSDKLVVSLLGYTPDTVTIENSGQELQIFIQMGQNLPAVEIVDQLSSTYLMRLKPVPIQVITSGELRRAACCNLARSFETNASVDVQYSDAISGAQKILFLGLSGVYSQIMLENIPYIRGLGHIFGLEYVPGPWIDAISVSKGTASVINGFESVTGQINVDVQKPESDKLFHAQASTDEHLKHRLSFYRKHHITPSTQSMSYVHYTANPTISDMNGDGFQDAPLNLRVQAMNYWNHQSLRSGFEARWGLSGLYEQRRGGQLSYLREENDWYYALDVTTYRADVFSKTGYVFDNKRQTSIGFINYFSIQQMESYFGFRRYDARQLHYYSNFILSNQVIDEHHQLQTGFSFQYDMLEQKISDITFTTEEGVPGVFLQHTFEEHEFLTLMTGLRVDYHNKFGFFWTPRVHAKVPISEQLTLRVSAGKGYRTPAVIAENIQILSTSRKFIIGQIQQEKAWNYGANIHWQKQFTSQRTISVFTEYYRTDFRNQLVIDYDINQSEIHLYHLDKPTSAQHWQVEADYKHARWFEIRTAFRYNIVKIYYNNQLRDKYLVPAWKQLNTLSLKPFKQWQFDITSQWNGPSALPDLHFLPEQYRLPVRTPSYMLLQIHINYFLKQWEFYAGVENILNYTIDRAIILYQSDVETYFDASLIWGPMMGRKIYAGVRLTLKHR